MLEWSEQFGCHSARVGRVGELTVTWSNGAYRVAAFGARLKEPVPDIETGKRRAVEIARRLLAEATAALP